jgi:hypothetical protein
MANPDVVPCFHKICCFPAPLSERNNLNLFILSRHTNQPKAYENSIEVFHYSGCTNNKPE